MGNSTLEQAAENVREQAKQLALGAVHRHFNERLLLLDYYSRLGQEVDMKETRDMLEITRAELVAKIGEL